MGSQSNQPKAQKGWLSRWTRKQWSRHWFVLKNGSLTYYRGPAAELCSFLDGVLDLSLIKQIEVPQQEGQVQQHHSSYHNHQQSSPIQQVLSQQVASQQHQQQQQDLHFSFTLKMWNGECHLLSAASHAERQLWLAAINLCNNFEDETASSDSSSSSRGSNISAKSTDVGCSSSCTSSGGGSTTSLGSTGAATTAACAPSSATSKLLAGSRASSEQPKLVTTASTYYHNAYQTQQQQQREAEISLEQLASKLKSVVRKRRDETPVEPHLGPSEPQLLTRHALQTKKPAGNSALVSCATGQAVKVTSQTGGPNCGGESADRDKITGQVLSSMGEQQQQQQQQAHKRRLMCLRTDSTDDLSGGEPGKELITQVQQQRELRSEPKLIRRQSDDSDQQIDCEQDEESGESEVEEEESGSKQSDLINNANQQPINENARESSEEEDDEDSPQSLEDTKDFPAHAESQHEQQQQPQVGGTNEVRPKKRVTFDLSNQTVDSSSSSESASSMSSESADEDELSAATTTTLSSASSASSEDDEEEESEDDDDDDEPTTIDAPATGQERATSPAIRQIDLAKRRLELRESLKYSRQRAMDEDEDSTCELVRKMIERRRLRLQKREGAAGEPSLAPPPPSGTDECDIRVAAVESGATSTTEMETNETSEEPQQQQQQLGRQLEQLELRLKTAEFNSDLLERRLNDSYLGYSQLELSYKQLQLELAKCQETQVASEAQAQRKIDELTNELKASELRLLEAKEKLLRYEEHLAKWQLINAQANNNNSSSILNLKSSQNHCHTRNSDNKQHSWLTKNYSNCLSAMNVKQKLQQLEPTSQQQQQVSSSTATPTSGSHHNHLKPQLLLTHHNQLKQTLALNQQQLSLKLLSQSKQIQRKLNELELKVDKIQSGGCSELKSIECEQHEDNNSIAGRHHLRHHNQHHLQQLVPPSGSATGSQTE